MQTKRRNYSRVTTVTFMAVWIFCTVLLTGVAKAAVEGDAFLYFGSTVSGSIPETYRYNTGSSSFACNEATIATAGTIRWIRGRQAPDSDEIIIAVKNNSNVLYVQRYSAGVWTNEWNVTTADARLDFDVAYEQSSGDVMVVYSANGSGQPRYRVWNGTSWTGELNVGNTFANSGEVLWIEAAERPGTDELAIVWTTASSNVGAMVWDGSSWSCNSGTLATSLEDTSENYRQAEIEYEQSSGDLLVMWAPGSTDMYARTKPAGTCNWNYANVNTRDEATNLSTAARPGSNEILAVSIDIGSNDLQYQYWNGSGWTILDNADTGADTESTYRIMTAAAWSGGRGIVAYADNYGTAVDYAQFNGGWGSTTEFNPTPAMANEESSLLGRTLDSNTAMFVFGDKSSSLWAKTYDSTGTWTNVEGGAALETSLSNVNYRPFELVPIRFAYPTLSAMPDDAQPATVVKDWDDIVMGSFLISVDTGSVNVSQIVISEAGTIDADANISNVEIWYDTDGAWSGNETQFGSTTSFDSSDNATFSGSEAIDTSGKYFYVVLDVDAGASIGDTIEIEITSASDVTSDGGDKYCSFPSQLTGTTTVSPPDITVNTTGTQLDTIKVDSSNKMVGIFTFSATMGSASVSQIEVSDSGTLDASTYLSNVELWYDTEGVFDGDETQFGSTTTFDGSEDATFSGSMAVSYAATVYVYVVLDVGGGAISGETIELEITASGDVTTADGTIIGTFPVEVSGTTSITAGPAATITVAPDTASLGGIGATRQFSVTGTDAYGNATSDVGTITWSGGTGIGSINPSTGLFTASGIGTGYVTASSSYGPTDNSGTITVSGTNPNGNWSYRKQLTITNNVTDALPEGYSVMYTMDHQTCYNGGTGECSSATGEDVRIYYFDGDNYIALDRVNEPGCEGDLAGCTGESGGLTAWNDTDTEIWFALYEEIPASTYDDNYWIYYGNTAPGTPPEDRDNIYIWYDDFSSNTLANYTNGKTVDIHGDGTKLVSYDSVNENVTFETGDNFGAGLRLSSLDLENVLVQVDERVEGVYPNSGTSNITVRWTSNTSAFYTHFSNGKNALNGGPACSTTDSTYESPCIGRADGAERNCLVADPPGIVFFEPTQSPCNPATKRFRYGVYGNSHYFWQHARTSFTPDASGTDGAFTSGQVGVQANQQLGWFDNIIVRHFVYPEPSITAGPEEEIANYKVLGTHPYITQVSQGAEEVQMLRLAISTASSENLTQITVTSKNDDDTDVAGVSAYYTGTNETFESSTPFGVEDQAFFSGEVTFSGYQTLPDDSTVYVFIVYDLEADSQTGNTLDLEIAINGVTLTSGYYPGSEDIDPPGSRSIAPPQTLGSITVINSDTGDVAPGDTDQQILRIAFPVSGAGSPQTLESITITSENISDYDVAGVSAYYTGTSSMFNTSTPFGNENQPFGGGEVTFTGQLDFEATDTTHFVFIAYDIDPDAVSGNTVDASIAAYDIMVEGLLKSPVDGDPAGERTVYIPTGNQTGIAPCDMLVDSNPSFMSTFVNSFYNTASDTGNCSIGDTIGDLEANDAAYAGLWMNNITKFDPQSEWVEFSYDLSSYGISGNAINSLTFQTEMFLVGNGGTTPNNVPAYWDSMYDSQVQIFNFDTGLWEDMAAEFLTTTASGWRALEGAEWDQESDSHSEKPLVRSKTAGFESGHIDSSGILKIRVWLQGALYSDNHESSMVFDYALINFNYGANKEQVGWRWLDEDEAPTAYESVAYTAPENGQLHLRVGMRSNYANLGAHYIGLQVDDNSSFTSPTLVTTTSSDVRFWNDTSHVEGNQVTVYYLSDVDAGGIYHEDDIPPSQTKTSGYLYEEDFTVQPITTGTFYLRTVLVDENGTFLSALDTYGSPIKLTSIQVSRSQEAYNWMENVNPYTPLGVDTPLEFTAGTGYIAAVRMSVNMATTYNWVLQYQKNPYTDPGNWTTITTVSDDWHSNNGPYGVDGKVVFPAYFVTGGSEPPTMENGVYDESGAETFTIDADTQTELWWSIRAKAEAAQNAYRFRVTNGGSATAITYDVLPEARDPYTEQTSFIWADETETALSTENTSASVAKDQPLHLRVGIRSNHDDLAAHYLALQYDTTDSFLSPTIVTAASGDVVAWDDPGNTDGAIMSGTNLLSGAPYDGIYHEDENQPSSQTKTMNIIYEEDFTVAVVSEGTYYIRVVEVDSSGANPQVLDVYSQTISVNASAPSNSQTYYAWAPDASTPTFQDTNTSLEFSPGSLYLLAIQVQNDSVATSDYLWRLQYKKTSLPEGSWTNVTTTASDWVATSDCSYGVHGKTITATTGFVTNGGSGSGTPEDGYFSETGSYSDPLSGNAYTEYWYCVKPTNNASKESYEFRLTNAGSTTGMTYNINPGATESSTEMTSYRWTDADESALVSESTLVNAMPGQQLHLRVGIIGDNGDFPDHYLALQYSTNITFTSSTIITTGTSDMKMWDDTGHTEGDLVSGLKLLSGSPAAGAYHEDSTPPLQTKTADTLYEEDFTIETITTGTYYVRAVEVDSSGAFVGLLDTYSNIAQINVTEPSNYQTIYNWSQNTSSPSWNGDNTVLDFTTGTNYIVVVKIENEGIVDSNFDWQLQYQKDPYGTPGDWTDVTTTSSDWQAASGSWGSDGTTVSTGNFATTGTAGCSTCTAADGIYLETGKATSFVVAGETYTEIWYSITADSNAYGYAYRFRATNSGSSYGLSYTVNPECRMLAKEQASFRMADSYEVSIAAENISPMVVIDERYHLRVGIRSKNTDWSDHYLGLQYDTSSTFSAPTLVTTTTPVKFWNDTGNTEGGTITEANILSGSPWDGIYHEDENQPSPQTKTMNIIYEEDFTLTADTLGTYYIRVVEVDSNGANPVPLDLYTNSLSIQVMPPNNSLSAYDWALNEASPTFGTDNTPLGPETGVTYIVAIQIDHIDPDSNRFNWRLQYQKDPYGSPGAWTDVNAFSADWRAVNGIYGDNGDSIPTGSFVTTYSGSGSAVNGVYSETGIVSTFGLVGSVYTELWYSIKPVSADLNYQYRFRVTNSGSTSGFVYSIPPETGSLPTTGTIVITEQNGCCTDDDTPTLTLTCEDPAGISCDSSDWMRFSCNEADWSSWTAFSTTYEAFNILTSTGCDPDPGTNPITVYVEYKNDLGGIQPVHASDSTIYSALPEITVNTTGDDTWRSSDPGAIYDVDASGGTLDYGQYTVWSEAGQSGTQYKAWTAFFGPGYGAATYDADFAIDYDSLGDGINYVSIRVANTVGATDEEIDAFYILKDSDLPTFSGVQSVIGCGPGCLMVFWGPASDTTSGMQDFGVYRSTTSGFTPDGTNLETEIPDGTYQVKLTGLSTAQSHYFVVRARDAAGSEDTNTVEVGRSAASVTGNNFTAPVEPTPSYGAGGGAMLKWQATGISADDQFGTAVDSAGDVNNDGIPDIIIGADHADRGGIDQAGAAYVYSGADGTLLFQYEGTAATDRLGHSVSGAGDINQDGYDDFLVGAYQANPNDLADAGAAYLFSGQDGSLITYIPGTVADMKMGKCVNAAGDINNDGVPDYLVSAFYNSPGGLTRAGSVFVYSGADGSLLYQKDGLAEQDRFGFSADGAGDVNNDGYDDFISGAYYVNPPGLTRAGAAYVFSGFDGSVLYTKEGTVNDDRFGYAVSGLGDVNGDGYDEFIAAAYKDDFGDYGNNGSAFVFSGATGEILYRVNGEQDNASMGRYVSRAGDVNNDGVIDFMSGADVQSNGDMLKAGSGYVYSGADGSLLFQKLGAAQDNYMGKALSGIGDIDSDGHDDVIITSFWASPGGVTNAGIAYIYVSDTSAPTITDNQGGDTTIRSSNSGTYDVDFADAGGSNLDKVQVRACSTDTNCGDLIDWTDTITGIGTSNYTTNWALPEEVWEALLPGVNYISVKVFDMSGTTAVEGPVFYVNKASDSSDFTAGWTDGATAATYEVALGDFDGDGDLDYAEANLGQQDRIYANDGTGSYSLAWSSSASAQTQDIVWGDFDNDGDLDAFAAIYLDVKTLYRNDGGGSFTQISYPLLGSGKTVSFDPGDFDNDGDIDLIEGTLNRNAVWENTGGNQFEKSWQSAESEDTRHAIWIDIDADSDLDMVSGNYYANSRLYTNNGDGTFTSSWTFTGNTFALYTADLNADGNPDIYSGNHNDFDISYTNDGSGSFTTAWTSTIAILTRSIEGADIDADGDIDILQGNNNPHNTRILKNTGAASFEQEWVVTTDLATQGVATGDVDSDGDADLLIGNNGTENIIYINEFYPADNTPPGTPTLTSASNILSYNPKMPTTLQWTIPTDDYTPSALIGFQMRIGTTPGGQEIMSSAISSYPGNVGPGSSYDVNLPEGTYYWSVTAIDTTGAVSASWATEDSFNVIAAFDHSWSSADSANSYAAAWGDYDGDGDLDILAGNHDQPNKVMNNTGSGFTVAWTSTQSGAARTVEWGDYDGDGDLDQLIANAKQVNRVFRNDGGNSFALAWESTNSADTQSASWGDSDNDGDLDILVGNVTGVNRIWQNNGADSFEAVWASDDAENTNSVLWADLNQDGWLDFIVGNRAAGNSVYTNSQENQFTLFFTTTETEDTISIDAADFNGNGYIDYIANNLDAPDRIYRNQGNGTFALAWSTPETSQGRDSAWGDIDGDGDLDVLVTNFLAPNRLYRHDSFANFTMIWENGADTKTYNAAMGDYDDDGDLDIFLSDYLSPNLLFTNNHDTANSAPSAPTASAVADTQKGPSDIVVSLSWTDSTDDITAADLLKYQVRVGTCSGCDDIASGEFAPPDTNAGNNASLPLSVSATGTYYWSVAAIDTTFTMGSWSAEDSFDVTYDAGMSKIGIRTTSRSIESGWQLVSVPLLQGVDLGETVEEFAGTFLSGSEAFLLLEETPVQNIAAALAPGQGFWLYLPDMKEVEFPIYDTDGPDEAITIEGLPLGWSIIGNPYTDALKWDDSITFNCGDGEVMLTDAPAAGIFSGSIFAFDNDEYSQIPHGSSLEPWTGYLIKMNREGCSITFGW